MIELGLFSSTSSANDWLHSRQDDEQIRFFGRHRIKEKARTGRPEYWFHSADVRFKRDNLRHECYLTEFLSLYWKYAASVKRGVDTDQDLWPDAEMMIDGMKYFVEFDTGKMTSKQLKVRFKKYVGKTDTILFVTLGRERRRKTILRVGEEVKDILCVASFAEVYEQPFGRVWHEVNGERLLCVPLPEKHPEKRPENAG